MNVEVSQRAALSADRYAQRFGLAAVWTVGSFFEIAKRKQVGVQRVGEHRLRLFRRTARGNDAGQLIDSRLDPAILNRLQPCGECQRLHHPTKIRAARPDVPQGRAHGELRQASVVSIVGPCRPLSFTA
jgi:hypothetical protein